MALPIALAAMAVLAMTTTGVVVAGVANQGTALVSAEGRAAFATAQAALAYGEGMVYGLVASGQTPPTEPQSLPPQPNDATGTYVASTSDNLTWHVVGTGSIGGVTRTVSVNIEPTQTMTAQGRAIWNYLYEDSPGQCVSGGSVITMPILANGNFCVSGGLTKILNNLEVNGNLTTTGGAQIGSASSPIARLDIVGTCAVNGGATTPGTGTCDGSHNATYATKVGRTLSTTPQMPEVDFAGAYATQAGLTKTGCPANLFDNDMKLNNSNDASIGAVMFGSTDYDCVVGPNEIRWNHSTRSLYVHGTFYFDGTLTYPGGDTVYSGLASMYFTGGATFSSGNATFCGIANCTQNWDTSANGIIVVAQCWQDDKGGKLITTGCVGISGGAHVQFGAWVATNYNVSGGSGNMGPILCDTFTISGGTNLLLPFGNFPPGTPVEKTVMQPGGPPTDWAG